MLALVAERKQLSGEVARVKRSTGRATRDYEREREVILAARNKATPAGRRAGPGRGDDAAADPQLAHHAGTGSASSRRARARAGGCW